MVSSLGHSYPTASTCLPCAFFSLCMWCTCVLACVWPHMCADACVHRGQRLKLVTFLGCSHFVSWSKGFPWTPSSPICLVRLASLLQTSCLCLWSTGDYRQLDLHSQYLHGFWGSRCKASCVQVKSFIHWAIFPEPSHRLNWSIHWVDIHYKQHIIYYYIHQWAYHLLIHTNIHTCINLMWPRLHPRHNVNSMCYSSGWELVSQPNVLCQIKRIIKPSLLVVPP